MKFIDEYILGKPQPVRLHRKVSKIEMMREFVEEWKDVIAGLIIAIAIICLYVPFL